MKAQPFEHIYVQTLAIENHGGVCCYSCW